MKRALNSPFLLCFLLGIVSHSWLGEASAITITGSNGRAVEFAGLKDATPKGVTAQLQPEGDIIGIPWEKLDLSALEQEHPRIYAAYLSSQKGETVPLNLGTFAPEKPEEMAAGTNPPRDRFPGWEDVDVGGATFAIQLPPGKARAILFVGIGDQGESLKYLTGFEFGTGLFGSLQKNESLALMTYSINYRDPDIRKMPDSAFAENGLADDVLEAVSKIAQKAERPELIDLPFLVYGSERFGSAVAYSFVQAKPEIVLAAVCAKGAFYRADPTPESAAVPMLFLWGEYSNNYEIWGSEHPATSALQRAAEMESNWTGGREFRGDSSPNLETEYFGKKYLQNVLSTRLRESRAEEGDASGPASWIEPYEREKGYIGTYSDASYVKIEESGPISDEGKTFVPNLTIAKIWKAYCEGSLEVEPGDRL